MNIIRDRAQFLRVYVNIDIKRFCNLLGYVI